MNNPHAVGWRQAQEANRLAQRALNIYPDDERTDRSSLRAKWAAAVLYMGKRWILNGRESVPWRALPTEQEAA